MVDQDDVGQHDRAAGTGRRARWLVQVAGAGLLVGAGLLTGAAGTSAATPTRTPTSTPTAPPAGTRTSPPRATDLSCTAEHRILAALDVAGPGRPSPEGAVAPLTGNRRLQVVGSTAEVATVAALDGLGRAQRLYQVRRLADGWWPDSFQSCRG